MDLLWTLFLDIKRKGNLNILFFFLWKCQPGRYSSRIDIWPYKSLGTPEHENRPPVAALIPSISGYNHVGFPCFKGNKCNIKVKIKAINVVFLNTITPLYSEEICTSLTRGHPHCYAFWFLDIQPPATYGLSGSSEDRIPVFCTRRMGE